jgi:UDPglucose 6-dehydrogenase
MDLVEEVAGFWARHGVKATILHKATSTSVVVSSRLLAGFFEGTMELGRNCYDKRIPNLIWDRSEAEKRALLAGMWRGDGWAGLVNGGPSVMLDYGTASPRLADGLLRLLGDLGVAARLKVGRTAKSTCDNYWIQIAGANQVEQLLDLVKPEERERLSSSIARQAKRIAPTGYRRHKNAAWVRVRSSERRSFNGPVYSLEVPRSHTFVTTGGLVTHNCFPKDVSALKQLAGNTGYHFQLLTAVIEVNELQKRRAIGKLQKHLGSLIGKEIALLGVAFKPNTDDIREATSLVLAGRLQSEGAHVRVYDPIASGRARDLLSGAKVCDSATDALDGADAAVLVTEWPEFRELDWDAAKNSMRQPLVVDGRNFLDGDLLQKAGFTYEGVGR